MIYPSSKLELSSSHPGSGRRLPLILGTEPFQTQKAELPRRPAFHPELETDGKRHGHNESQQVKNMQRYLQEPFPFYKDSWGHKVET